MNVNLLFDSILRSKALRSSFAVMIAIFLVFAQSISNDDRAAVRELKARYKAEHAKSGQTVVPAPVSLKGGGTPIVSANVGFKADFEDGLMPPTGWQVQAVGANDNGGGPLDPVWTTNGSGYGTASAFGVGTKAASYNFWDNGAIGDRDSLFTSVATGLMAGDYFQFSWAYAGFTAVHDSLIVMMSLDGGANYTRIFAKGGRVGPDSLKTAPAVGSGFVPSATQWKTFQTAPFGNEVVGANVKFLFETYNDYGNLLWVDNVELVHLQAGPAHLTGPANASGPSPLSPLLTWNAGSDALTYDVLLDVVNPPGVAVRTALAATQFVAGPLTPGTIYYWDVKAFGANNTPVNADNGPFSFTTGIPPAAPTGLVLSNITQTSMDLSWNDVATDEDGYRVYRSLTGTLGSFVQVGGDLPAGSQTFSDAGPLALSTRYFYEVRSFNSQAESEPTVANRSTLATVPGVAALSNASYHSIKAVTSDGTNPANSILIAIQVDGSIFGGKTTKYVQSNGTLGDAPYWKSGTGWGGAVGVTILGLYPGTSYDVTLMSANTDTVQAGSGALATLGTTPAVDVEATPVLESFTTTTFPPPGWLRFDVDNDGTAGTYGMWHRATTNLNTPPGAARYFCNDPVGSPNGAPVGLPGNDYLYTVPIQLTGGVRYNITFYYRTVPGLGHDIATVLSTSQNPAGTIAILEDRNYESGGAHFQAGVNFEAPANGIYYLAFWDHSAVGQSTNRFDDVNITRAPDFDLLGSKISQELRYLEDYTSGKVASKANRTDDDENANVLTHSPRIGKPVSNTSLTKPHYFTNDVKNTSIRASFKGGNNSTFDNNAVNASEGVQNLGQNDVLGSQWGIDWVAGGVSQPQATGVDVAAGGSGDVPMLFDAPDVGTYFTVSNIALTGDGAAANDTVREWLVSYPANGFVIDYDSAGNSPSYRNGWPANVPLDAAVRFTMPDGVFMKLAGFNSFYRNTASNGSKVLDSLRINVWAIAETSGVPDYSTVGANLFSKKVGGDDYLYNGGNFGAPFTIPLTDANMSFGPGDEFILSIGFGAASSSPMGWAQSDTEPNHVPGISYESSDGGATWVLAGDGIDGIYHIKALGEKLNAIYASKVEDEDGDLGTTEDQTPVEGALISLYDGSNNLIDELATDANGQVLFSPFDYNLPDGDYTVVEADVNGYQALSPSSVVVSVAGSSAWANFATFKLGSTSGMVYADINGDDDATNEVGYEGVEVVLSLESTEIARDTTDVDGLFSFGELGAGAYSVDVVLPDDFSNSGDGGYTFDMTSGGDFDGNELGVYENAHLGGVVYEDMNANGTRDEGDAGYEGVTVYLDGEATDDMNTDANGLYNFTVSPGTYTLEATGPDAYDGQSQPAGETGMYAELAVDGSGTTDQTNLDFGYWYNGSVSGTVYLDADGDGTKDEGELGLAGWEVKANTDADTTDANGAYSFVGMPGTYDVMLTSQDGWTVTSPEGAMYDVQLESGGDKTGNDFGVYQQAGISGTVISDADGDGTADVGETGVASWVVTLYSGANSVGVDTTDANGAYSFSGLAIGSYTVKSTRPAGYNATTADSVNVTLTSGQTGTANFLVLLDTYKFRTFKAEVGLTTKATKMSFKAGVLKAGTDPNLSSVGENLFLRIGKAGAAFLGIAQTDAAQAKLKGWIAYKKFGDLAKLYTAAHDGQSYPIDSLRVTGKKSKKLSKAIAAAKKTYNNPIWEQGVMFNLNIIASADSVTPKGFGSLLFDTTFTLIGRELKGLTLNQVKVYLDSLMTEYTVTGVDAVEDYNNLGAFANLLKRINESFYTAFAVDNRVIDTVGVTLGTGQPLGKKNAYAVTLLGYKTATEAGRVKKNPSARDEEFVLQPYGYSDVPVKFEITQNYPNPFNPTTNIDVAIPEELDGALATMKVYNVLGQEVATILNNTEMSAGINNVTFDASKLSSGVYFYRISLNGGEFSSMKKMVLMK